MQPPLKSGLKWLEEESSKQFLRSFLEISERDQKSILDEIAFEIKGLEKQPDGISFFSLIRDLFMTGYFTSEVGLKDLGYMGNTPNVLDGIPEYVLKDHDVAYGESWLAKFID